MAQVELKHWMQPSKLWDRVVAMFTELYATTGAYGTAASEDADAFVPAELHIAFEGVPVNAAQATLARNPAGDDNALTFTAVAYGAEGNDITIAYVDPAANDAELSVSVDGTDIVVSLATGVAGAITSTAAEVLAAIEATPAADALVTVVINAADTGAGDDGSGVVTALAAAPMTGGAGSALGLVLKGGLLSDITNGLVYRNSGTQAAPVWAALADA